MFETHSPIRALEKFMFQHLSLTRPLAVIDLETTGIDTRCDRIVEISVLRIVPPGVKEHRTRRLNPGIPIPADATAIHGITDADVADMPMFANVAANLREFLNGCDLCGYNLNRFDLRMLHEEFKRANVPFDMEGRAIVDACDIFHKMEPRNLSAAVRFFLNREHEGAHGAESDVLATLEVLDAMLGRYADLPRTPGELHTRFRPANTVDSSGFFNRVEGVLRLTKGKYRGQPLDTVAQRDPGYLRWMQTLDCFEDTKAIAADALARVAKS